MRVIVIEFYGSLSDESITKIIRKQKKYTIILFGVSTLLLAVLPTTVLGILHHTEFYYFLGLTILVTISGIFAILVPPNRRLMKLPRKISINQETITIAFEGLHNHVPKTWSIAKIKKIIDVGEFYYIIFRYGDTSNAIICQKDLIVKGDIEEFEKIFESKIVREQNENK